MKLIISFIACSFFIFLFCGDHKSSDDSIILIDHLGTDKASGYSMQSKMVSCERDGIRKTHIVYSCTQPGRPFEPWKSMTACVATFNHNVDSLENHTCLGTIFDNHGTPCIAIDSQGYLHVVYGSHHHPFIYKKSIYPNNSTEWGKEEIVSFVHGQIDSSSRRWFARSMLDDEWTYTIIKVDNLDNIHVAGSLSGSAAYVRKIHGRWEQPRRIYEATRQYCRYNVMMNVDVRGNIYILAPDMDLNIRDDGYASCDTEYMLVRSRDRGDTFESAVSAASGHFQGNGNLAVDPEGFVHFLCMERHYEKHRYQIHIYEDSRGWHEQKLVIPGRYIWDASLSIGNRGTVFILCAANLSDHHWRHASNEIYLMTGTPDVEKGYRFSTRKIVNHLAGWNRWLPNLEENQIHSDFSAERCFMIWTEEIDLKGNYTSHKNSSLTTEVHGRCLSVASVR